MKKKVVHKAIWIYLTDSRLTKGFFASCNLKNTEDKHLSYRWKNVTCKRCLKLRKK